MSGLGPARVGTPAQAALLRRHCGTRVVCEHLPGGYCLSCPTGPLMLVVAPTFVWQFRSAAQLKAAADALYAEVTGGDPRARVLEALAARGGGRG